MATKILERLEQPTGLPVIDMLARDMTPEECYEARRRAASEAKLSPAEYGERLGLLYRMAMEAEDEAMLASLDEETKVLRAFNTGIIPAYSYRDRATGTKKDLTVEFDRMGRGAGCYIEQSFVTVDRPKESEDERLAGPDPSARPAPDLRSGLAKRVLRDRGVPDGFEVFNAEQAKYAGEWVRPEIMRDIVGPIVRAKSIGDTPEQRMFSAATMEEIQAGLHDRPFIARCERSDGAPPKGYRTPLGLADYICRHAKETRSLGFGIVPTGVDGNAERQVMDAVSFASAWLDEPGIIAEYAAQKAARKAKEGKRKPAQYTSAGLPDIETPGEPSEKNFVE